VILDVDVQGGIRLKEIYKNDVLAVFVKVNSVAELERRLRARNTEGEEALQMRVAKAAEEMALEKHFDVSIVNEDLAQAKREAENLVRDFISVTV
jgi:guanylate kinase